MLCPKCQKGNLVAGDSGSSMGLDAFCDDLDCFSWFKIPDAVTTAETVFAPSGVIFDERVTRAMHARDTEAMRDSWEDYIRGRRPIIEKIEDV